MDGTPKKADISCGPTGVGGAEYQPLKTFFAQGIEPSAVSSLTLSGGKKIPYYFSLGINSTVPFVQLEGGGGTQKEFSWGETIEIPPNQTYTVRNVSYMKGDIQIQSGKDHAPCPARIQKRLQFTRTGEGEGEVIGTGTHRIDCRRARRAYLVSNIIANDNFNIWIRHFNQQHTSESEFEVFYTHDNGNMGNMALGYIPVGLAGDVIDPLSHVPFVMGDYITVEVGSIGTEGGANLEIYCVLEYL